MTELSVLLDIISDRQLREYVAWLDAHPDSDEEDSIDYLMEIMTDSQIDMLLEMEEFNATPYSNWFGACLLPDGRCMETTMSDCRVLGGRFQGPGTSCGGHYTKPVMYQSEYNAPPGKVFHDPAAARDPRLKNDNPPSSVTQYLKKHPEVANLYDDDDASVMVKGIIIGCLIGALGTIFGNIASEMIIDKFKINPQFKWDR